ncbi:MAG: hypothetical protein GEU80_05425 [Dehalococcoidia bacterium]|nr:hypothetical protein [Dehalococcoidia bacterium]
MRDPDLHLLLDFLNAHHHAHDGVWVDDCLASEQTLRAHFAGRGWPDVAVHGAARGVAYRLRNALSARIPGSYLPAPGDLDGVARELPLRVASIEGAPRLVGADADATDSLCAHLARVLGLAYEAMTDGTWARLKACRNQDDCQWVFLDRSKNRSRVWCSMETCGTTAKVRAYRARQRAARDDLGAAAK